MDTLWWIVPVFFGSFFIYKFFIEDRISKETKKLVDYTAIAVVIIALIYGFTLTSSTNDIGGYG